MARLLAAAPNSAQKTLPAALQATPWLVRLQPAVPSGCPISLPSGPVHFQRATPWQPGGGPNPALLAAGRVPGLIANDKPDQPPAADTRIDDLRRFWKRIAPLLASKDLGKISEILTPEYALKLKETVPQYTDRFWTHVGRYTTLLDTLPADGAGMRIAVTPGATPDELQLEITPNDGKMPLRPIVVRDGARWKLKRF